jgi:hypothetical protein
VFVPSRVSSMYIVTPGSLLGACVTGDLTVVQSYAAGVSPWQVPFLASRVRIMASALSGQPCENPRVLRDGLSD